ncbi:hypothetical protein PTQ19_01105 [Microbacterium esteraromaticum]|uniref:hypothetical protein n=1 Tax=Microbacterium esteraromaticum TaxID=57043 RepID=UPI00236865E0|nr:hypothetical protein [Microbacterium esteraromaticum]WDH79069.1 hypothetical protein PTQ19_01105 [Microbacterium esteraromaticum]
MGMFTQKPQEPSAWAALPGEPLEPNDTTERLDEAPPVDLLGIDLGTTHVTVPITVTPTADEAGGAASDSAASGDPAD